MDFLAFPVEDAEPAESFRTALGALDSGRENKFWAWLPD